LKPTIYTFAEADHGNDGPVDEVSAFSRAGIDTLVSMLTDEEAKELGL
jgi:hypothetical protein